MKLAAIICLICQAALAQYLSPDITPTHSASGQFIIYGASRETAPVVAAGLLANGDYLPLDPNLLAVCCERIKQALWRALGLSAAAPSPIDLILQPAGGPDDSVTIVSDSFRDGWRYHLQLPNPIQRERLIRAIVNVLLLDLANARPGVRDSAEIPLWLSEGLTRHLLGMPEAQLTPRPTRWFRPLATQGTASVPGPRPVEGGKSQASFLVEAIGPTTFEYRRTNSLEQARRLLEGRPPLTLEQLSWPEDDVLSSPDAGAFAGSAQLLVTKLLRIENGPSCLRDLLDRLSQYYNWQTAFQIAFHDHFKRPLDFEKWWAIQTVSFTEQDPNHNWTPRQSWENLDAVLRVPVQVRNSSRDLPQAAEVSLTTVIGEWDRGRQDEALRARLLDLRLMRPYLAPDFARLADDYVQLIAQYLEGRARTGMAWLPGKPVILKQLVLDALDRLDALETTRQALRPEPALSTAQTNGASAPR